MLVEQKGGLRQANASNLGTASDPSALEVQIRLVGGIGISVINSVPEELVFISLEHIEVNIIQHLKVLERLSYGLEKVFAICLTDQSLARLKLSISLFPPRKLLILSVNSSIAQSLTAFQMTSKRNFPESSMER